MLQLLNGTDGYCDDKRTRSEGGSPATSQNSCSEGGDIWSPASSTIFHFPGSRRRTKESTSDSQLQFTMLEVPTELEVGDLRSRLDVVTRQLAERDEIIDNLSSELAAFKALYKEAILEMNRPKQVSSSAARASSPNLITPERPLPFRTKSVMNLREIGCNLAKDCDASSVAAANSLAGNLSVTSSVGDGRLGSRLGRSYSWREGRRSRGIPATLKSDI
ncbi:hypothetical protein VaNZ11_013589 [Volvox africanus]|uniref:Uncharacterized protein n=1 Tax=Volvox africanus TaxID=51714 RepID=A0ABQ5SGF6_9CHLO|nr:hypothetical protein VaNZ11_013589 [Volvox africanus]